MNFEEAVKGSSVVQEEHKETLVSNLRKIPDFSWLTGLPHQSFDRLQGDFFSSFPIVYLRPNGGVLQNRKTVMVINNTCDLPPGRNTMVTVAPVFDLEKFLILQTGKRTPDALADYERDVRHNQICELLYVPHLQDFPNGAIIRLDRMCSVASDFLESAVQNGSRIASFTQNGFYVLLMKLTYHLTRTESSEVTRNFVSSPPPPTASPSSSWP